jgi:hypothetical protein
LPHFSNALYQLVRHCTQLLHNTIEHVQRRHIDERVVLDVDAVYKGACLKSFLYFLFTFLETTALIDTLISDYDRKQNDESNGVAADPRRIVNDDEMKRIVYEERLAAFMHALRFVKQKAIVERVLEKMDYKTMVIEIL